MEIQEVLKKCRVSKTTRTALKNSTIGEIVYKPPEDLTNIQRLMNNLEQYLNDNNLSDYDPIVNLAVINFQFESIHPLHDGNGRTGRIMNILYLILNNLHTLPIIHTYKQLYY